MLSSSCWLNIVTQNPFFAEELTLVKCNQIVSAPSVIVAAEGAFGGLVSNGAASLGPSKKTR